jgi:hypothetical protein
MKKKAYKLPPPYAALTKDARFEGTFEVLVPDPDRVKPHRIPRQFKSQHEAETFIHSEEGKEMIADLLNPKKGK